MHPTTPRPDKRLRAGLYARVSTDTQTTDNQLLELREYAARQGWTAEEYTTTGSQDRGRRGRRWTV